MTLDLWHTLIFLEPEAEEEYMASQVELAGASLAAAARRPGAAVLGIDEFRSAFSEEYAAAVAASQRGRTVTPGEQIERAAARAGRVVDTRAYLGGLRDLVARTPFREAPGAREMLHQLRDTGLRTALISNTTGEPGAAIRPVLTALGFDGLLDTLVFSDEQPWSKPAPEIFATALTSLGIPPSRAVHVGDGWVDIEGARRAGLRGGILFTGLRSYGERYRALFLPDGWSDPPTDYRTDRLSEVPRIAARLLAPGTR